MLLLYKKDSKNKNERTEYYGISIPFKSQVYSNQGKQPPEVFSKKRCSWKLFKIRRKTPVSGLLKSGESNFSLVWVTELLVNEKNFPENSDLPNLVDIQR